MSSVSPVTANPDIVHLLVLRKALDAQRTAADGIVEMLAQPPSGRKVGTPAVSSVSADVDLDLYA
jgi:hypothetical protein